MLSNPPPTNKSLPTRAGRWFAVRIMPYRTLEDRIDGVVIMFADITVAKTLEAQSREKHTALEKLVTKQSSKPAADKVTAKTAGRKETNKGAENSAAPGKT
jgi:hypothetical protein